MITEAQILNASVLIVDDQESNIQLLEEILQETGYTRVSSTMDPHAVAALHREHRYDLILLDLQMPDMDGFQVMQKLKAIETESYMPVRPAPRIL
jgi:two-component system, cell cycle response regulator